MDEVWERFALELDELIDAGDRVVVIGRLTGRGRRAASRFEQPIAGVWTVHDGRMVRGEIGYTGPPGSPRSRRAAGVGRGSARDRG